MIQSYSQRESKKRRTSLSETRPSVHTFVAFDMTAHAFSNLKRKTSLPFLSQRGQHVPMPSTPFGCRNFEAGTSGPRTHHDIIEKLYEQEKTPKQARHNK